MKNRGILGSRGKRAPLWQKSPIFRSVHFSNCVPNCVPGYATCQEAEAPEAAGTRSSKNTNRPPQDAIEMEFRLTLSAFWLRWMRKVRRRARAARSHKLLKLRRARGFFFFSSLVFFKCFHGQGRLLGRCIRWDTVWDTV